ncbi:uncharacterized protein LOC122508393 [Leptopilina heterotoma]|uniref:uncharacterized protein LOC122508393 n=1 Tax=Leptopilina heterotoma TaxID=63436 RepID=UPI001CA867CD|nr:uncharacterized protein LOC122508393 [Leptopilina heterotoma]
MFFSKSALLIIFAACTSCTMAQLAKYNSLSVKDLQASCEKNGGDIAQLETIHTKVDALFNEKLKEMSAEEALKTDCNCLGPDLKTLLKEEMAVVKNCLKGEIELSDDDIKTLIGQSVKKLCALNRLSSFEKSLSTCINADEQLACETIVLEPVEELENSDQFANLGLTFSPEGKKVWTDLLDCSSKAIENCSEEEKKTHLILTMRMKDAFKDRI